LFKTARKELVTLIYLSAEHILSTKSWDFVLLFFTAIWSIGNKIIGHSGELYRQGNLKSSASKIARLFQLQ